MKQFLRTIKVVDQFTTEIEINKQDFIDRLQANVDRKELGFFSDSTDIFSSSKNDFKGIVGHEKFKIKRKRKFFDFNVNLAVAKGTYRQKGDNLLIEAEINGFTTLMIPFYVFLIIFYTIFVVSMFKVDANESNVFSVFPFILFHALFMFGLPYFFMRSSTKRLKHELEREFYYLTKK